MPSYKKHQSKKGLVEQLIKEGKSKSQIAELTEVPYNSLSHYMKIWGLSMKKGRPQPEHPNQKWRGKKDIVEELVRQGKTVTEICKTTEIPLGSITACLRGWNLLGKARENRGTAFTVEGYKKISEGVKRSHQNNSRKVHPFANLFVLRGEWLNEDAAREEYQFFIDQDLKLREMAALVQVDQKTVTNHLKRLGLQQGIRKGNRVWNFKGYVRRYRGSDWLPNRELALERDDYRCTKCGKTREEERAMTKRDLHVHHLIPWIQCQSNIIDNLITVCEECHSAIHTGELSTINLARG